MNLLKLQTGNTGEFKNRFNWIPLFLALVFLINTGQIFAYHKPEAISREQWVALQPYLMPENHPIKSKLDQLFTHASIIQSADSLKKVKIKFKKIRFPTSTYVAKHSSVQKHLFKFYTKDQHVNETEPLLKRIKGAETVRRIIERDHLQHLFRVPRKWLYPLPHGKENWGNFILVVEKIKLLNAAENQQRWKSDAINRELLVHLHRILSEAGLYDSVHVTNIPFAYDGRIAFIDTEHHHWWPIHYHKLTHRLSKKNRLIWESLKP